MASPRAGAVHGVSRTLGVPHNRRAARVPVDPMSWRAHWRWRSWDGILLLVGAGAFAGHALWLFAAP